MYFGGGDWGVGCAEHSTERSNLCKVPHSAAACPEARYYILLHRVRHTFVSALNLDFSIYKVLSRQFNISLWKHDKPITSSSGDLLLYTHLTASPRAYCLSKVRQETGSLPHRPHQQPANSFSQSKMGKQILEYTNFSYLECY